MAGLYYEEFTVGMEFKHALRRTVTEMDNVMFCAMTHNPQPLHLDHRAGFLLSCIDGMSSIDDILDVSGMRELDALRILFELVQENVIAPGD